MIRIPKVILAKFVSQKAGPVQSSGTILNFTLDGWRNFYPITNYQNY